LALKTGLNQEPKSNFSKKKLAVVVVVVASLALAGTYFGIVYFSQSSCPSGATLRSFAIVANDTTGYNDSRYQPFEMNVHSGDCVLVTFVNNSTAQSHGLGIANYLNSIVVQPNKSESVKFLANKTGQFQVSEPLFSTVNAWTDRCGTLNVA